MLAQRKKVKFMGISYVLEDQFGWIQLGSFLLAGIIISLGAQTRGKKQATYAENRDQ
jgi:hypothetical protein